MTDNVRKATRIVIRRNGEYLVGKVYIQPELRWSWSIYDAWRTKSLEKARKVARATGGTMVLFNPVLNRERVI